MIITFSYFLFGFILPFSNVYSVSISNLTSNSSELGKCDFLISEYINELEESAYSSNAALTCKNVLNCINSLSGESAQKLKKLYGLRCEKHEFRKNDMIDCHYEIIRLRDIKCPSDYDILAINPGERRKALYEEQSCILSIVNKYCSTKAFHYLSTNYDQFVNYLTIKPENDYCESVYSDINTHKCFYVRGVAEDDYARTHEYFYVLKENNETLLKSSKLCKKVRDCGNDKCNTNSPAKQVEQCNELAGYETDFYECIIKYGYIRPVSIDGCSGNNTMECIRTTMLEKCGEESVIEFESNYKWFNKNEYDNKYRRMNVSSNNIDISLQEMVITADAAIGKCGPIVDKLVNYLIRESTEDYKKQRKITDEACRKVMQCYESFNTEESQKLFETYRVICENIELYSNSLFYCFNDFYMIERDNGKNIENSDFFSRNLTIRKQEFLFKKPYVMNYAKKHCSETGVENLNSKYEHFVNLITTKPEGNDCKSHFSQIDNHQCTDLIHYTMEDVERQEMNSTLAKEVVEERRLTKKCIGEDDCYAKQTEQILSWCESVKSKGVYFYTCLDELRAQKTDYSDHHCVNTTAIEASTSAESFLKKNFKTNRDCLKIIMLEKCGSDAIRSFNDNFENVLKSGSKQTEDYDYD
ncbi:hypothetical protein GCK72_020290 [Caenorhabditis remanei]|uniref:T20D4.11-like domain-containing protein n=1 Tax=Caenorhabditis remanei TaxID=31234 RepID=A0A6A5GGD0_CAERE|nr:hypothetical protein GCK72_020290 [Caenorhabditis remanei]KAF1753733.1 hypothetical protein GCK72_020290 [Caenorhabditis remanei]